MADKTAALEITKIVVVDDPAKIASDWDYLADLAGASIYQSRTWVSAWLLSAGARCQAQIIVAYGALGEPLALLPLMVDRSRGFVMAQFCGGREANYNMALAIPQLGFSQAGLRQLLATAATQMQPKPDIFLLTNQPETWEKHANPFLALPHQSSPSFGHRADLTTDGQAFIHSIMSKDSLKKLRKKQARLSKLGTLTYAQAVTSAEKSKCLAAFHLQKQARMKELGIANGFGSEAMQDFLRILTLQSSVVQWYYLQCGDQILATYAGGCWRGRFQGMANSFDANPALRPFSPGNLLLNWLILECCQNGLHAFDLGIGEARYKSEYCEIVEPLFDVIFPITSKGRILALIQQIRLRLKRHIKQTPVLWSLAQRLRAHLGKHAQG